MVIVVQSKRKNSRSKYVSSHKGLFPAHATRKSEIDRVRVRADKKIRNPYIIILKIIRTGQCPSFDI